MDLRIEKTYQSLLRAFTELIQVLPYDAISVAALCQQAVIRRTTFYKHFADKDDFLLFFMKSMRDEFQESVQAKQGAQASVVETETNMLLELIAFLKQRELLVDHIVYCSSSAALGDMFQAVIEADIYKRLVACGSESVIGVAGAGCPPEAYASFCSGGMVRMLVRWWKNGHQQKEEAEIVAALQTALRWVEALPD